MLTKKQTSQHPETIIPPINPISSLWYNVTIILQGRNSTVQAVTQLYKMIPYKQNQRLYPKVSNITKYMSF